MIFMQEIYLREISKFSRERFLFISEEEMIMPSEKTFSLDFDDVSPLPVAHLPVEIGDHSNYTCN